MKKVLLITFCFCAFFSEISAQISEGGTPPSFNYPSSLRSAKITRSIDANINKTELLYQDSIAEKNGSPLRIATLIPVDFNINNSGEWMTLPSKERIWQLKIHADGANSLILGYKDFYIPEGGKLFVYNKNRSQIIGAYTENTNPEGGKFSNQIMYGDEITLEYVESAISTEAPRIVIEDIGYVYRDFYKEEYDVDTDSYQITRRGTSASCMIDINCSEGDNWRDQQRGVVSFSMKFPNAWYICSGSLINNTQNNGAPYLLTATHCFFDEAYNKQAEFNTAQFYFNYERAGCKLGSTTSNSLIGSQLLATTKLNNESDGLLLLLNDDVPKTWNPYYNGWDVSNTASPNGAIIHHPNGDVKKITTYTKTITRHDYYTGGPYHWRVTYAPTINGHSVTEGGSSGSPLFNNKGLIIGTLTGGASYCVEGYYPEDGQYGGPTYPDYYGNLYYHWDKFSSKMKPYLDPDDTGITSLAGYDPNRGTGIESEKDNSNVSINLVLFPNPAYETLNINSRGIIKNISIYNLIGGLMYSDKNLSSSTTEISVASWNKGVYNVVVETENGTYTSKVNVK